jgi:uncharacterized DUF497 family protein
LTIRLRDGLPYVTVSLLYEGHRKYGATEFGRILYVVYTMCGEKVRPITARAADGTEKRRYRRGRR